jgi:hypothetical protein
MQVIHERCAALDVQKKTVVTTIMKTQADGSVQEWTRTFLTMTADLLALDDWLGSHGIEIIAMESTGVFWRPVFNLLEEGRQVILVNAQHMKAVPGRKTDVKDSQWLADLLRHGLLKASFIPPKEVARTARLDALSQNDRAGTSLRGSIGCKKSWRQPISSWHQWRLMWLSQKWTEYARCHTQWPGRSRAVGRVSTRAVAGEVG